MHYSINQLPSRWSEW